MDNLKVLSTSELKSAARAIINIIRKKEQVENSTVGAGAVNQAVKSITIARGYLTLNGYDLVCISGFIQS